jgi:DUF4097 and DUF4098 domain-containing protein YvlB
MRARAAFILIPALAVLTGCEFDDFGGSANYHEDFHYNYPMKAGARLSVEGFNGSVEITAWDQDTVDISGTKSARSDAALADIRINVDHQPDAVSIRASRPTERNGNYGVQYVIKAPRGALLDRIATSNGSIRASDFAGPAVLHTSNASVHVNGLKGDARIETSNGSLELNDITGSVTGHTSNSSIRGRGFRGELDLTTSNGGVDLTLDSALSASIKVHTSNAGITLRAPGTVNARLSASTSNGSISSDFDLEGRGDSERHHVEATLGRGGPLIDLQTSNGGIKILRQ